MDIHNIVTPVNRVINFVGGSVKLCWSSTFGRNRSAMFSRKQKIVDSEVLRYCAPLSGIASSTMPAGAAGPEAFFDELHDTAPAASRRAIAPIRVLFIFRIIWL